MLQFDEYKVKLNNLAPTLEKLGQALGCQVVEISALKGEGGVEAAVYGFAEDPKEGLSSIECRLELLKISDEVFSDAGHAIEWCIRNAH